MVDEWIRNGDFSEFCDGIEVSVNEFICLRLLLINGESRAVECIGVELLNIFSESVDQQCR